MYFRAVPYDHSQYLLLHKPFSQLHWLHLANHQYHILKSKYQFFVPENIKVPSIGLIQRKELYPHSFFDNLPEASVTYLYTIR